MCLGQGHDKRIIKVNGQYHTYIRFNTKQYDKNKTIFIIVNNNIIGKYNIINITKKNNYYSYHFNNKISYYKKYGVNIVCDIILVSELKEYIKGLDKSELSKYNIYFNKNIKGNKGIRNIVLNLMNGDKKSTAKKDEDMRVQSICNHINNKTDLGLKLIKEYYELFGLEILKVEKKGGNNIHYDILIYHTDGTINKCEEKGSLNYNEVINDKTPPHEKSVEFYNGPAKNFSISKKYLKLWYDLVTNNSDINKKYNLPDSPPFEEWLIGGPYCMVDPTSEYSIKNKENYRYIYPKKSMNGWGHDEIDYRIKPNDAFSITEDEKLTLIKEVQDIYDHIMNEKEVWLQTTGDPQKEFSFKWYNKIEPKKIIDVELVKNKDIEFIFKLDDKTSFTGIMRWGKGCGFSCFRMDLK